MADDDNDREDQNGENGDEPGEARVRAPMMEYVKLAATILVTLLVFTLLVRGCASCQTQNPFTGEPLRTAPPAPGQ